MASTTDAPVLSEDDKSLAALLRLPPDTCPVSFHTQGRKALADSTGTTPASILHVWHGNPHRATDIATFLTNTKQVVTTPSVVVWHYPRAGEETLHDALYDNGACPEYLVLTNGHVSDGSGHVPYIAGRLAQGKGVPSDVIIMGQSPSMSSEITEQGPFSVDPEKMPRLHFRLGALTNHFDYATRFTAGKPSKGKPSKKTHMGSTIINIREQARDIVTAAISASRLTDQPRLSPSLVVSTSSIDSTDPIAADSEARALDRLHKGVKNGLSDSKTLKTEQDWRSRHGCEAVTDSDLEARLTNSVVFLSSEGHDALFGMTEAGKRDVLTGAA